MLSELTDGVFEAHTEERVGKIVFPRRMTVLRLHDGGLLVHSPNELCAETKKSLDNLGPVRWIVSPNRFHHFYVEQYADAWKDARVLAAKGLPEKRPGLPFSGLILPELEGALEDELDVHEIQGMPKMNEVVLRHKPSRTLILTDLMMNIQSDLPFLSRTIFKLAGTYQRLNVSRLLKMLIKDREAFAQSLHAIAGWDFDRIVMAHGKVIETDGHALFRDVFRTYLKGA